MNRLRSTWAKRWMAALLVASLLPVTFATAMQAARPTDSFGDWVRGQLRVPADAAVERALDAAEAQRAGSLEAFLHVFVEAYEAEAPGQPLADIFDAPARSNESLITYLASRFRGLVADALPPRTALQAAQTAQALTPERSGPAGSALLDVRRVILPSWARAMPLAPAPRFVVAVWQLSAAQPLGP